MFYCQNSVTRTIVVNVILSKGGPSLFSSQEAESDPGAMHCQVRLRLQTGYEKCRLTASGLWPAGLTCIQHHPVNALNRLLRLFTTGELKPSKAAGRMDASEKFRL